MSKPARNVRAEDVPEHWLPYCMNSRQWLIWGIIPRSCPYLGYQGASDCLEESCGYYEWRAPTRFVLNKVKALKEAFK